jgi:hypothetical protein
MTAGKKLWRNRKERKEWARRLQSEDPGLEAVQRHAAGIDVGNSVHYVAVRPDRDPDPADTEAAITLIRLVAGEDEMNTAHQSSECHPRSEIPYRISRTGYATRMRGQRGPQCSFRFRDYSEGTSFVHCFTVRL